jgi:nitrogen regulatory protein PII
MGPFAANLQSFNAGAFTTAPGIVSALCQSSGLILVSPPEQRSDAVTAAIQTTARTEQAGEDKILARPIERAVRIRNGETGGSGWVNLN